ncbi:hypothetical protein PSYPI_49372, partial [Pseudomonas syringae pv. pisi str. 1704B]
ERKFFVEYLWQQRPARIAAATEPAFQWRLAGWRG